MRRIIAIILSVVIIVLPVMSLAAEYSSMSDDDLLQELDQIRAEVAKRDFNPEKIICDSDGMVIMLAGDIVESTDHDGSITWTFPTIGVNSSDIKLYVSMDKICVNGWEVDPNTYSNYLDLGAGNKIKKEFQVKGVYEQTDITSFAEVETVEFVFHTTNSETSRYITKDTRKTIVLKKDE